MVVLELSVLLPLRHYPRPGRGVKSFVLLPGWWAIPASTQRPSFRRHNRVCVFMIYWFDEVSTSHAPLKGESLLSLPSPSAGAFFVLCVTGRPVCVSFPLVRLAMYLLPRRRRNSDGQGPGGGLLNRGRL